MTPQGERLTPSQKVDILALFEDIYKANMRQSLPDINYILAQIEAMPKTRNKDECMRRALLYRFMGEALDMLEMHLGALRTRYAALPELEKKEEATTPRSGECVECGRFSSLLSANGSCEGCVMQAAIDAQEESL